MKKYIQWKKIYSENKKDTEKIRHSRKNRQRKNIWDSEKKYRDSENKYWKNGQ